MNGDDHDVIYFAETEINDKAVPFGIKNIDRSRHMYVVGKTGMGKSTLLENLAAQDIVKHHGMAFFDPHGNIADYLLDYVPEDRVDDVVYLALSNNDRPFAFNILDNIPESYRPFMVDSMLSAFASVWSNIWSSEVHVILEHTLYALFEFKDTTLVDMHRMLTDEAFRNEVAESLPDSKTKTFWVEQYDSIYERSVDPLVERISSFVNNSSIRSTVGRKRSTFSFVNIMKEQKLLIVNLSRGSVGAANASLLGNLMIIATYVASISRFQTRDFQQELPPFYLFIDEFHTLTSHALAEFLPHATEYKVYLALAHQYVDQVPEDVRNAIFSTVGSTISFRATPSDAALLEQLYTPTFSQEDIQTLGFAEIFLTLMIDGVVSPPFKARTLGPIAPSVTSSRQLILENSRERYGAHLEEHERVPATEREVKTPHTEPEEEHQAVSSDEVMAIEDLPTLRSEEPKERRKKKKEKKKEPETKNQSSLRDAIAAATKAKEKSESDEVGSEELEKVVGGE